MFYSRIENGIYFIFSIILVYIVLLYFTEVVLGSCEDVCNPEVGYEASCDNLIKLSNKQFFSYLLPFIFLFVVLPLLLVKIF